MLSRSLIVAALIPALIALPLPQTGRASPPLTASLVAIPGVVPAAVQVGRARRLGALPGSQRLDLAIALAPRNERALDAALAAIYDPRSPMYHRYLTPAAVRARFGPDAAAVADLASWLRGQGLQVQPWTGGPILDLRGSAARIAAAFHIGLWRYLLPAPTGSTGAGLALCPGALLHTRPTGARHPIWGGEGPGGSYPTNPAATTASPTWATLEANTRPQPPSSLPCDRSRRPPDRSRRPGPGRYVRWYTGVAPDRDPLLPARFAPLVRGVVGLATTMPAIGQARVGSGLGGTITGYTPDEIAAAYDFQPLYAAGYHGEGTRVALLELAPYNPADIQAYAAQYGVNPAITTLTVDGGNNGAPPSPEATLDLELLSTAAPGAAISVYNAANDGTGKSVLDALSAVAGSGGVQALALTWVECEQPSTGFNNFVSAEHTSFKMLALQGTTVLSASGDAGAYACSGSSQPAVVIPASDPYALAVGATDLTLTGTGGSATIASEVAWSCSSATYPACRGLGPKGGGSGGGLSQVFGSGDSYGDDLSWQVGPGVENGYSNGSRQVPDVTISGSLNIDNAHQYSVYYQGTWETGGGTSTSTPMWAALILLADQYLKAQGDTPVGWVNPLLYKLGATAQPYPPYHDITSGNNLLYPATPGWDYASGWGSPDAWNVLRDLAAANPAPTATPTITPSGTAPSPSITGTIPPTGTPTLTPTAARSPTRSPTRLPATATATSTPSATPTATGTATASVTATRTALPSATPICPPFGIGNGRFETGTLTCWAVNSGLQPHISTAVRYRSRYSVQLGAMHAQQRNASVLRQDFLLPPDLAHPVLHFSYWLARLVPRGAHPAIAPVATIFGPLGRVYARVRILPHRDRAWSGFKVALPECTGPACSQFVLELAVQVPPQPPGVNELLYLDDVYIGS